MEMLGPLAVILLQSGQTSIKQTQTTPLSLQKNNNNKKQNKNPTIYKPNNDKIMVYIELNI